MSNISTTPVQEPDRVSDRVLRLAQFAGELKAASDVDECESRIVELVPVFTRGAILADVIETAVDGQSHVVRSSSPASTDGTYPHLDMTVALAVPLAGMNGTTGRRTLRLLTRDGMGSDASTIALASALAGEAQLAISNGRLNEAMGQLSEAVDSNRLIGLAMGIVMMKSHVEPEDAFELMRVESQRCNVKLREIAARVVNTRDISLLPTGLKSQAGRQRHPGPISTINSEVRS